MQFRNVNCRILIAKCPVGQVVCILILRLLTLAYLDCDLNRKDGAKTKTFTN